MEDVTAVIIIIIIIWFLLVRLSASAPNTPKYEWKHRCSKYKEVSSKEDEKGNKIIVKKCVYCGKTEEEKLDVKSNIK